MLPDRVSNPGPLTYESGVLPIALRGPALSGALNYKTGIFSSKTSIKSRSILQHGFNFFFNSFERNNPILW